MQDAIAKKNAGTEWDVLSTIAARYNSAPLFRQALIYALSVDRGTFVNRGGFAYVDAKMSEAGASIEQAKAALFPEVRT